jgi:hypothetical protein
MASLPTQTFTCEKQLLVCCCRTRLDPQTAADIRRLLSLPLDWNYLIAAAASNSITPLLSRNVSLAAPGAVPPGWFAELKERARKSAIHSLLLSAELIRVLDAFAAAGIQAIPYKGPVVAAQAYGDIALREFEDLDLVLRQRDIAAANAVLVGLGFTPQFPPIFAPSDPASLVPGEYDYRDTERHLTLELHTERTLRHFPKPPGMDAATGRLVAIDLSGHSVRTFRPEDSLVFLCVHGSKDFWERLVWVADVAELLASHPRLEWQGVYAFADAVGARRMLHLGLALADEMLGIAMPDAVRSRIRKDRAVDRISAQIVARLLSGTPPALGARATFAYRRQMVAGAWDGWRYMMRLATAPAAEDWHAVRLPRPLAPIYAALRPLRLLRKYSAVNDAPAPPPARTGNA